MKKGLKIAFVSIGSFTVFSMMSFAGMLLLRRQIINGSGKMENQQVSLHTGYRF